MHDDQNETLNMPLFYRHNEPVSTPSRKFWLDFSQSNINPYFNVLFRTRPSMEFGKIQIALRPDITTKHSLLEPHITTSLLQLIRPMFVTQPSCRVIGMYHYRKTTSPLTDMEHYEYSIKAFLSRVHNEGIRVGDIVDACMKHAPQVLSAWLENTSNLRELVSSGHWVDDIWHNPGRPQFELLLDNAAMSQDWMDEEGLHAAMSEVMRTRDEIDPEIVPMPTAYLGHNTRPIYLAASGFRDERQGEWIPADGTEPTPLVSSIRYSINWNR